MTDADAAAFQADMAQMDQTIAQFRARTGDDVAALLAMLEGPDQFEAALAAHRLGELRATEAVGPLVGLMRSTWDTPLVAVCTAVLGSIGDCRAVEPLIELLETAEARAERETDHIRAPGGWRGAILRLSGSHGWDDIRESSRGGVRLIYTRQAIHALGKIGDPRAADAIRARLDDPDEQVRRAAAEALGRIEATNK